MNWIKLPACIILLLLSGLLIGCAQEQYDILITGGTIIDGTGAVGFEGDVAIKEGRIAAVGDIPSAAAARLIDAKGKYVVPGFIDLHTHGDRGILAAEMLEFSDRGLLKEGYVADIVVFDPETIRDKATFSKPHQYSEGIDQVFVNGALAVDGGEFTGTLAGKPLRKQSGN